jgi:inorganic pyrophosphatase/exopolyphosphatase
VKRVGKRNKLGYNILVMEKIGVITASDFADLDGLACATAYTELLSLEGKDAEAIIPGEINASVTDEIRNWELKYKKKPSPETNTFCIVDVSRPQFIPGFAIDKATEIYDHHEGSENFWFQRLGDKAKIEKIGAAATLIWEEFKKRGKEKQISQTSARLLYGAIISNTLNFNNKTTSERDLRAFEELSRFVNLPEGWTKKYFADVEKYIQENPKEAITNDIKQGYFDELGKNVSIGQLELWDSKEFVLKNKKLIEETMESSGSRFWFFSAPSISEGKSYVITKNEYMKDLLSKEFGVEFVDGVGEIDHLIERKEYVTKFLKL